MKASETSNSINMPSLCIPEIDELFLPVFQYGPCILSHVQPSVTPWAVACQAPLSVVLFCQEILKWAAVSFSEGIVPSQGSNLDLLQLLHGQMVDSLPLKPHGKPKNLIRNYGKF